MAFLNVAFQAGRTEEADQAVTLVERIAGSDSKVSVHTGHRIGRK